MNNEYNVKRERTYLRGNREIGLYKLVIIIKGLHNKKSCVCLGFNDFPSQMCLKYIISPKIRYFYIYLTNMGLIKYAQK